MCFALCWPWSRFRFVRFASDERASTMFALLAECFETLGGVPKTVLADRMGCLKAGVVANVVVPTADYVRFATSTGSGPTFVRRMIRSPRAWWNIWSAMPSGT
jgi:transposase